MEDVMIYTLPSDKVRSSTVNRDIFAAQVSEFICFLAMAMKWRPLSSSVSKAHFVTAGSISMKLGVRIPLGNTPRAVLAHLPGAYASTWRPASSASVSRARFVTAGAVYPKLCTYVPLGKNNSQTKTENSAITAELMA
jgi:hypothetical protein